MGTGGLRIIKYRGRHWIFENDYDSYPKGMGKSLVDSIPTDPDEYQIWLQAQRARWAKWDDLLQTILAIKPEDLAKLQSPKAGIVMEHFWQSVFDERLQSIPPSYHTRSVNFSVEWVYTIDLDREIFSVDNGAHFRLYRVSGNDDWIKALALDADFSRLALPQYVGEDVVTSLTTNTEGFAPNAAECWKTLKPRVVTPNLGHVESDLPTVERLRWMCFNCFQRSQKGTLSVTLLGWTAHDMPFREIAYFILCLAAGGDHLTFVDDKRVFKQAGYAGMLTGGDTEDDMELVGSIGAGYHKQGLSTGLAPDDTMYWFEGALVSLVPRLNRPGVLEKAIADVVQYGNSVCGRTTFNAVLISIEHLALVRSFPHGVVDHTSLLPLIPIALHLSMDARERYGGDYVDELYRADVLETEDQVASEDDQKAGETSGTHDDTGGGVDVENSTSDKATGEIDEGKIDDSMAGQESVGKDLVEPDGEVQSPDAEKEDEDTIDEKEQEVANDKITEWTLKKTFTALIAFFEASILETLRPANVDEQGIPTEIYETVLSHVADIQTYNACLKVSRRIRSLCLRRPLVLDNVIFLEPKVEPEACEQDIQPAFSAVEISTGRRMDISIGCGHTPNSTICQFIAGSEKERRAFVVDEGITFKGLNVPSDWDWVDHTTDDRFRSASLPESTDDRWNRGFSPVTERSSTNDMRHFWKYLLMSFGLDMSMGGQFRGWELPANTRFFLVTYELWNEKKFFHYLAIRVKRACSYWTCLWDDIIQETVTSLGSLDDTYPPRIAKARGPLLLGAASPFVLLAIGSDVRLFRWMPTYDEDQSMEDTTEQRPISNQLVELHPGQVFDTLHDEGRKPISDFLEQVKKYEEELAQKYPEEKEDEQEEVTESKA